MILQAFPDIAVLARIQRCFLARAVQFLVGEAGIRQFLDIGTGLPTADNTHEMAQRVAPECRIVYVDNDPAGPRSRLAHQAIAVYNANSASSYHLRSPEQLARFFDGLELVEPGVVTTSAWRPDIVEIGNTPSPVDAVCGVGRKI